MFDLISLIKAAGYLGVAGIVFAECGLLIGFFLPGDSLLFTAGFLASQDFLDIRILAPLVFVAAVVGDNTGYWIGRKLGPKVFNKKESILFKQEYVDQANAFFKKHGGKTVTLARFVPVVRTFVPVLAGVGGMHYRTYVFYSVLGGIVWGAGLTLLGYYLGSVIPNIDRYLLPIIAGIILISVAPNIYHLLKDKKSRDQILSRVGLRKK